MSSSTNPCSVNAFTKSSFTGRLYFTTLLVCGLVIALLYSPAGNRFPFRLPGTGPLNCSVLACPSGIMNVMPFSGTQANQYPNSLVPSTKVTNTRLPGSGGIAQNP